MQGKLRNGDPSLQISPAQPNALTGCGNVCVYPEAIWTHGPHAVQKPKVGKDLTALLRVWIVVNDHIPGCDRAAPHSLAFDYDG